MRTVKSFSGPIPIVDPVPKHRRFMQTVHPEYVYLKMHNARQLLKQGYTAPEWAPDSTGVITSSSINDSQLLNIPVREPQSGIRDEVDIVTEFQPVAHIGGDFPIYPDRSEPIRRGLCRDMMENVITVANETPSDIPVFPIIKGYSETERNIVYTGCEFIQSNVYTIYGTQFFTSGGNRKYELLDYVSTVHEELTARGEPFTIWIIGLQTGFLSEFPSSVSVGVGKRHERECNLETTSKQWITRKWNAISAEITDALRTQ